MFDSGNLGLSLLEVIIASGMVAGLGAVVMKNSANNLRSMKHVEVTSNYEDVREYVRSYLSCRNTNQHAAGSACVDAVPGGYVNVKQHDGTTLIKIPDGSGPQKIGNKYLLRASCPTVGAPDLLRIEIATVGKSNKQANDNAQAVSLHDKKLKFRDLFKGIPISCPPIAIIDQMEKEHQKKWKWDDVFIKPKIVGNPNDEGEIDISACAATIPELRINIIFDNSGSQSWNDPNNIRGIGAKNFLSRLLEVKLKIPTATFSVANTQFSSSATAGPLGWLDIDSINLAKLETEVDDLTNQPQGGTI